MRQYDWLKDGVKIKDLYARSGDAEFILDSDFTENEGIEASELDWSECLIPVTAFGIAGNNLEEYLVALNRGFADSKIWIAEERARYERVRQWMSDVGGVVAALNQSPMLVTIRNGEIQIEDGYHRLGVAIHCFGETHVRALCAEMPPKPTMECEPTSKM